mmetsp:Transcript_8448/g.14166  ORF Transcript_8448/g.14166 Transcript_8448/m.14166 type:complete len:96 (+) Transcript_8448:522-809(+)
MYHCSDCDCCVEGHDHHCGVVGVCIGDKNFRYFLQFLSYTGLQIIMVGVTNIVFQNYRNYHELESKKDDASVVILMGATSILGISIIGMSAQFYY